MKRLRFESALSAVALAGLLAGCAAPMSRSSSAAKPAAANLALALRAQMALGAGDTASAVSFAERAVENSPRGAAVRALLGNAYFASGRFVSAESAFRDSLTLEPNQPQVILKLALVQIAQGKNGDALSLLESGRGMIDAADYGLAMALAGQPNEAIQVLEPAARSIDADSRVRQNLALAYGLSGDWTAARTIAAQDLPADQLDSRVQQWMALAKPARASDQVAALTGIAPAADPGQPVRLALNKSDTRLAEASVPPAPFAEAQPPLAANPVPAAAFSAPEQPPVQTAVVEPAPTVEPQPNPAPVSMANAPIAAPEAASAFAAFAPSQAVSPPAPRRVVRRASEPARRPATVPVAARSGAVVQLGAYRSPQRVSVAWDQLTRRYPALRNYSPMRARFDGPQGTVWRLSVKGFASQREAIARCNQLRSRGGNCFVRSVAGDAPVQLASR
jgi:Flp pilus assembly protein TadD